MPESPQFLVPDWPAPNTVRAAVSMRHGGYSKGPYSGFNLGEHVDDEPEHVRRNRQLLRASLELPDDPVWLAQVHGTRVMRLDESPHRGQICEADASVTDRPGQVCAVLTADCLPVFLADRKGRSVGVAHAGWRGLAAGVLESTIDAMRVPPTDLLAWLGPAIGPEAFEVGAEVRQAFIDQDACASEAFTPAGKRKYLANLFLLARQRLEHAGVAQIAGGGRCTCKNEKDFFSYRRDGRCGRMVSLIWMTK